MLRLACHKFSELDIPAIRYRTWFNVQEPDHTDGEYPDIYPHVHHNSAGTTMVLYIDPGDVPAPLEVLSDDLEIEETIIPEAGKCVFIPNGVWHSVHKNRGTRPRVAMIVTGYSK